MGRSSVQRPDANRIAASGSDAAANASCVAANFEAWFTIVSCNTPINAGPSGNASAAIDALSGSGDAYDLAPTDLE